MNVHECIRIHFPFRFPVYENFIVGIEFKQNFSHDPRRTYYVEDNDHNKNNFAEEYVGFGE